MKKRLFIGKRQRSLLAISCLVIGIIIFALSMNLMNKGNDVIEKEIKNYMSEISQQTTYKVNQRVSSNLAVLTSLSKNLSHVQTDNYLPFIKDAINDSAFEWIGFINSDGILKSQGHSAVNVSQLAVVQEALNGEKSVSSHLVSIYNEKKGALYVIPFINRQTDEVAIAGWIPPETMRLLLNTDTFSGTGFSHIISSDGDFVLYSSNENALITGQNFFTAFSEQAVMEKEYSIEKMKDDIAKGKSGTVEFNVKGDHQRSLSYTPLEEGKWYLLSIVPTTNYVQNIKKFMDTAFITLIASISLLFIVVMIILLRITYKKNKEITDIAYRDPVTNGFTPVRFEKEFATLAKRKQPFTFVSMDLRKFKLINDAYGSQAGNQVLNYIHRCIRNDLHDDEFVARINADNFNFILKTTDAEEISQRLDALAKNINCFNNNKEVPYYLPINCGSYIVNDSTLELIVIRDKANIARKENKEKHSFYYLFTNTFYNDIEHQRMVKEKDMENMMEKAMREGEFEVYLQPKVSVKSGKIIGAEALARWNNPTKGMIPPNDFIPFFERNNFIIKLDKYIFELVCKTIRGWIDQEKTVLPVSVNLSRNHLHNPDFLKDYKKIQEAYAIPSELIEIELTETVVFENLEMLKNVIKEIHECGYKCSMDDFGSGYSSLNVLKEIPVDILKLDRIFFDQENNQKANDIVESVINLAKKLGMATIAEGIETIPQVELLKSIQCDMIQGYVFSKPINVKEFENLVKENPVLLKVE